MYNSLSVGEMLAQLSYEVSRSAAVVVDSCDRRRPSAGSGTVIGGGLELVGSLKSHVFRVRFCVVYKRPHATCAKRTLCAIENTPNFFVINT